MSKNLSTVNKISTCGLVTVTTLEDTIAPMDKAREITLPLFKRLTGPLNAKSEIRETLRISHHNPHGVEKPDLHLNVRAADVC